MESRDHPTSRAAARRISCCGRKKIGLHHLALKGTDFDALDAVYDRVSTWPGVDIECAPCPPRPESPARHFLCIIPGGLRFEFFAAPQ